MRYTPEQVLDSAATVFDIPAEKIIDGGRYTGLVYARHTAMYLILKQCGLSTAKVGDFLGGFDHTTVINARNKVKGELAGEDCSEETQQRRRYYVDQINNLLLKRFGDPENDRLEPSDTITTVVVMTREGLFRLPLLKLTDEQRNRLRIQDHEGLDWNNRINDERLWDRYGKDVLVMLRRRQRELAAAIVFSAFSRVFDNQAGIRRLPG